FHRGRAATVIAAVDDAPLGVVGELHPSVAEELDLPRNTAIAELDASALADHSADAVTYVDVPRFPPVRRDLAFTVDIDTPAGEVARLLEDAGGGLVDSIVLFDVFTGDPVPPGRKSLAFSVDFRAPDRTLTDAEVDSAIREMVNRARREAGAELRA
ncbi:MAG TPA: phenylalanine--tRNA ligase subunit beta, partial [Actinomycetota bacterium]